MLSPSDEQVAARDPELVGLPILLDPPALLQLLRQRLPDVELKQIRGTYLRYKPQTNCLASYQLETPVGEIDIHAKAYTTRDAAKLGKIDQRRSTSLLGPGDIHLNDLAIGISIFPNDASLPYLSILANDSERMRLFQRLSLPIENASSYSIRRLAYKPERRYVGQLRLDDRPHAVLRFYTEHDFRSANRNAKVLRPGKTLRLAGRLGRSKHRAITALRWLEGTILSQALANDPFNPLSLKRVGQALAEFHQNDPRDLAIRTREMEVDAIDQSVEFAAAICPRLAQELADLADGIGQYLLQRPMQEHCVHGDLYPQQILLQEDGVALLDLDEAYRGDSAADIGNFLAHVWRQAPQRLHECREALLSGYSPAGGDTDSDHIQCYTAASLLRLIPEPFRRREADWPERTQQILQEAQRAFARRAARPPPLSPTLLRNIPVHDPFRVAADPAMPFLAAALDPASISSLFATYLPWPARLLAVRVVRYKPQRRCLIEYDIETGGPESEPITLIGKARARRLDEQTFLLQRQLWSSDFGNESKDGISVPQPVAMIPPLQMWLQRRVRGVACIDMLLADSQSQLVSRLAQAIFKLHECPVHPARSHRISEELRILREKLPLVGQSHPHLERRLQRLLEVCSRIGESLQAVPMCPVHRDFYHDQVIIDGSRIYLLDLDLFAMGDPALDVGNFIGHLIEYALRKLGSAEALAEHQKEMIDRYVDLAGEELRSRIYVYSSLTLARHICISTLFDDRTPFIESILTVCERRMAEIA